MPFLSLRGTKGSLETKYAPDYQILCMMAIVVKIDCFRENLVQKESNLENKSTPQKQQKVPFKYFLLDCFLKSSIFDVFKNPESYAQEIPIN